MAGRFLGIALAWVLLAFGTGGLRAETRLALVLGSGSYQGSTLETALNDAGLMAQTLRDLGFSTVEGADLPQADLRAAIAGFVAKVREAGPDTIAVVYLSGLGLQHESDSYLIPSDAAIERESDVPINGIRLVDLIRSLASIQNKAKVVLLDLARDHPWAGMGVPVLRGIGLLESGPGVLVASAAAAGEVSAPAEGAYGRFALALAEQLRAPGVPLDEAIARARLRVHQQSNGRDTPWEVSGLVPPVPPLTLPADPAPTGTTPPPAPLAERRMEGLPPEEAYALAVERDTIAGYQEFLRAYPDSPFTRRVQRLLAARREGAVWRQTARRGSPEAYWTYLRRYPRGPHAEEARWRLQRLQAAAMPPESFDEVAYDDIPEPLPGVEIVDDPAFWEPAPPAFYDEVVLGPVYLGPPPEPIWHLPPPPPYSWGVLPVAAAAAAIVAVPYVLPRTLRRPVAPVVLRPPPGGPRPGFGPRPPIGAGGPGRALPGAPGGAALPGRPPVMRPGVVPPGAGQGLARPGGPAALGRAGRPGAPMGGPAALQRAGRPQGQGLQPRFQGQPRMQVPRSQVVRPQVVRPQVQRSQVPRPQFQPRMQVQRPAFQARPQVQRSFSAPRPSFQARPPQISRPSAPARSGPRRHF